MLLCEAAPRCTASGLFFWFVSSYEFISGKRGEISMAVFHVEIVGIRPLLMHRFGESAEESLRSNVRRIQLAKKLPREEAEEAAYRLPDGRLYLPSTMLQRAFVEAASDFKQRGERQSMKYAAGAAFDPSTSAGRML